MNSAVTVFPQPSPAPEERQVIPQAAMALLIAIGEALLGRRPLHQLRPYVGPMALINLTQCVDSGVVRRMQLGRIRAQMPTSRAVEAVVRLVHPNRSLVCALRLDAGPTKWQCTDLTLLVPQAMAA